MGIILHPKVMGKGIGEEALELIDKKHSKNWIGIKSIYTWDKQREACEVLQKNGWECKGEFKKHLMVRGEYRDILVLKKGTI